MRSSYVFAIDMKKKLYENTIPDGKIGEIGEIAK